MLDEGNNWGIDPLEFISRLNSSFENHTRVDGRTKKVLFHSWMNGSWNKRRIEGIVSSDDEWEESDYGNLPNAIRKSFFKPLLNLKNKITLQKRDEVRKMKRKDTASMKSTNKG
ncbi:hypothetical protein Tco_0269435 [Tanacetum coccineum]